MPAVVVYAKELSRLETNAPGADVIREAFVKNTQFGARQWGAWVGPKPRVTRQAVLGSGFLTHAAWLYAWDEGDFYTQHARYLQERVREGVEAGLHELSSAWTGPVLVPYATAVNGPVSWWSSGQAAVTRTENEFPTGAGRLDPAENPIGPTTSATHPTTTTELARGTSGTLLTFGLVALGLYGAALAAPYVMGRARRRAAA